MPARFTLGIDLGGTTTVLAVIDAQNNVTWERVFPTRPEAGAADVLGRVARAAHEARAEFPFVAAGAAVAAQINPRTGVLVASPNLKFENVPLAAALQDGLGVPVVAENDVNAAAYAEYLSEASPREPLLAVFVGTGIGGGLITGGKIFHGADGFAAEIGHVPVVAEGGEPCGCGRRGCVEAYAGGAAIVRRAAARRGGGVRELEDVDAVVREAEAGDEGCRAVLEEAAAHLGVALAAAVNLLNPGTLVIGGGVARAWPPLAERAVERMRASALPPSFTSLATRRAIWDRRAGVIGAAALARRLAATADKK